MTDKKAEFKIEQDEKSKQELQFVTREELLSIIASQGDLKRIFDLQEGDDPSTITQEKLDVANEGMHHLATVGQIFQIAGSLNETTKEYLLKNISGLFDTIQIQKIILQKLGANPVIAKEAIAEYTEIKNKKQQELKEQLEALKKGDDDANKSTDDAKKEPSNVKPIRQTHARKARGSKKSKR